GAAHVAPPPVAAGPLRARLAVAVAVALAAEAARAAALADGTRVRLVGGDALALGMLAQRLLAAVWAEDLRGRLLRTDDGVVVEVGG
ncbi:hypothetical protein, partial [Kineococcus glutinatus]|uniref:hypothetical protein n=1 Tax=Kineococcus glutinatus TaxID=1070872 RepID=UPI0031E5097E